MAGKIGGWMGSFLGLLLLLMATGRASAHAGEPPAPHDLPAAWNGEPILLLGLAFAGFAYAFGARSLWRRAGAGRKAVARRVLPFAFGWLALFVALVSPLDALGAALFSAHMLQHLLLMQVAAPLLVLGLSPAILAWGVPHPWRRSLLPKGQGLSWARTLWKLLSHPLVAWSLHVLALWAWHVPGLYAAALADERLHALEHISFLGSGLLYWASLLDTTRSDRLGSRLLSIFTLGLQSGLLGALLTFSSLPWYAGQSGGAAAWGLTPLGDQQLAGVLMWVAGGAVYLVAALWLLGARLAAMEREDRTGGRMVEGGP